MGNQLNRKCISRHEKSQEKKLTTCNAIGGENCKPRFLRKSVFTRNCLIIRIYTFRNAFQSITTEAARWDDGEQTKGVSKSVIFIEK
jgi:hypothetical protein